MNQDDKNMSEIVAAARRVVDRYEPGVEALAAQIGRTPKYLLRAISGSKGSKLNIVDSVAISRITSDNEILEVFASQFGCKLHPLPKPSVVSDDPLKQLSAAMRSLGMYLALQSIVIQNDSGARLAKLITEFGKYCALVSVMKIESGISLNQYRQIEFALCIVMAELPKLGVEISQFAADIREVNRTLELHARL